MPIADAELTRLATTFHTPLYVFDEASIRQQCRALKQAVGYADSVIRYACKALTLGAVLRIIRDEGLWIDASSINEVHRALRAGFSPEEIYYTGEGRPGTCTASSWSAASSSIAPRSTRCGCSPR